MKLVGSLTIGNKTFTEKDSTGKVIRNQIGLDDTFYGGNVPALYKTKYGIYICLDKRDRMVNLLYFEDKLTPAGIALLNGEQEPAQELTRKELIAKAKELGIEGKIATLKTEELIEKIKESESEKAV